MAMQSSTTRKVDLKREIEDMLYGFGDESPSDVETVTLVEALAAQYIENLTAQALVVADMRGKLDEDCFKFVVRKDNAKFGRIQKLLTAHEEIKQANKSWKEDDESTMEKKKQR